MNSSPRARVYEYTYAMRFVLPLVIALFVSARADAGRGTALVKYLPDDTTAVVVGDVAKSRGTPMFKKLFKLARDQNATLDSLATSLSVEKLIDTIVMGANPGKEHAVIVIEGRVDKLLAEAKKSSTKQDSHAGTTFWVTSDGEFAVVDGKLVFASAGEIAAVIDRAKDKKAKGPQTARTLLAATNGAAGVVGGVLLDATQRSDLGKQLGADPQWATFSLSLSSKLGIEARVRFADDASAQTATKKINEQLGPEKRGQIESLVGKQFSDSIAIQQDKSFARLTASMTADEVDKVLSLVKMLM